MPAKQTPSHHLNQYCQLCPTFVSRHPSWHQPGVTHSTDCIHIQAAGHSGSHSAWEQDTIRPEARPAGTTQTGDHGSWHALFCWQKVRDWVEFDVILSSKYGTTYCNSPSWMLVTFYVANMSWRTCVVVKQIQSNPTTVNITLANDMLMLGKSQGINRHDTRDRLCSGYYISLKEYTGSTIILL